MYFPYLRGKQFELIALRELLAQNLLTEAIIPVIEPVKASSTLLSVLVQFQEKNHPIAVIQNPRVAPYTPFDNEVVTQLKQSDCFIPALFINQADDLAQLGQFSNTQKMVIVTPGTRMSIPDNDSQWDDVLKLIAVENFHFLRRARGNVIELEDSFNKAQRNADYLDVDDELFSDNQRYFRDDGLSGFSDYSVVGKEYTASGFAPMAVAIHVVYFDGENSLRIKHFVSDSNQDISDPAGKAGEALEKLVKWVQAPDFDHDKNDSQALASFIQMAGNGQYSGLGIIKKLSIQHHLEIMGRYLTERYGA
ncbi:sce7725 family protein [Schleiferilactobacillus shenzhenensis]|uniref:Sce7725 family protein n=1 Tax=Schleiferilactobacillus shenzhenensis LY-73 TaxID=1231336 RepID=U4TIE2_9LACO|nr:sce7725 family protein [Schleiferilactobacillus shenzhenensis]ERL64576.1 hypothetical protein L248_0760 [Schleiferilactobacillus shenzhenensis LY-73]